MNEKSLRQGGFSLLELVVALAVAGIVAALIAGESGQLSRQDAKLRQEQELLQLRTTIRLRLGCANTLAARPHGCTAGALAEVRGLGTAAPVIIRAPQEIPAAYTKIGPRWLAAVCTDMPNELRIVFSKDQTMWQDLFDIPLRCSG